MSFVGSMLGNSNGSGYQASGTNIVAPTTVDQANQAQAQNQTSLAQQQALVNATGAQNGLGNQTAVYNQLQGVANGTGANPAQAQLAQATGANVANQAALMAGQRGSGANVGLMARQAGQQGASTQQQAAGQAATMQANQSLNALNNMGGLATSQANQQASAISGLNSATQTNQANLLNSINAQNNANVGMQSNINTSNEGIAKTNAEGQQQILGGAMNAAGAVAGLANGGMVGAYDTGGAAQLPPQASQGPASALGQSLSKSKVNDTSIQGQPTQQGPQSGAQALYQGMSSLGTQLGGKAKNAIMGGQPTATDQNPGNINNQASNPYATAADFGPQMPQGNTSMAPMAPANANGGMMQTAMQMAPMLAMAAANGGMPMKAMPSGPKHNMKSGGGVPGKPNVAGAKNTLKNDTVPAVLSPGEIVIPRSITQGKNPAADGAKFIAAIMAKKGAAYLPSKGKR